MTRLALAALLAAFPLPAAAQSWCSSTGLNEAEQAVCSDTILSQLDYELQAIWDGQRRDGAETREQSRWRTQRRDACGYDVFCIEEAYQQRIAELTYASVPPVALRRPWCGSSRLNAAETTICDDDRLADLDAAMGAVYGAAQASDRDAGQQAWLEQRNGCGTDRACIGAAYLGRIIELGGRLRAQ